VYAATIIAAVTSPADMMRTASRPASPKV
jgi:hypothetical protein